MNESASRLFTFVTLLVALALGACSSPSAPPPLEGASMGGPFTLTDQNGRRVSDRDFAGKYRLVYFGYTFCPDVCPIDMQVIGAGLRRFEAEDADRANRVQPIFISVDPARDTPARMRAFLADYHPSFVGLTGTQAQVDSAKANFRVFATRKPDAEAPGGYVVPHTAITYLLDREGRYLAHFGDTVDPVAMVRRLTSIVTS